MDVPSIFDQETQVLDDLAVESPKPLIKKRKIVETQLLDLANTDPSLPSKSMKDWIMDSLHEHLDPVIEKRKKQLKKLDELKVAMTNKEELHSLIESLESDLVRLRNKLSNEETKIINIELELRESNKV